MYEQTQDVADTLQLLQWSSLYWLQNRYTAPKIETSHKLFLPTTATTAKKLYGESISTLIKNHSHRNFSENNFSILNFEIIFSVETIAFL